MSNRTSSTRRDFITGKAAGQAAADVVQGAADRAADGLVEFANQLVCEAPAPAGYVVTLGRRAMACNFEILLNAGKEEQSPHTAAAIRAIDLVDELETQLTVYRETSELIELNGRAADEWVDVEPRLFALLQYADRLHQETAGAFDLTGGPLSKVWGFFNRAGRMPTEEEIAEALAQVGWKQVALDPETGRVRFSRRGVEINVNSLGKGYALDRAAELLEQQGAGHFLLHGGRSTLLARGDRTGEEGWLAGIRHPLRPQQRIAMFRLNNQAISTSGSATQSFRHRGKRYGHLIDPRTGWPAHGLYSATVIAPTATEADALSTAFYVMGAGAAAEFARDRPEIKALLVGESKGQGEIKVRRINLDTSE